MKPGKLTWAVWILFWLLASFAATVCLAVIYGAR